MTWSPLTNEGRACQLAGGAGGIAGRYLGLPSWPRPLLPPMGRGATLGGAGFSLRDPLHSTTSRCVRALGMLFPLAWVGGPGQPLWVCVVRGHVVYAIALSLPVRSGSGGDGVESSSRPEVGLRALLGFIRRHTSVLAALTIFGCALAYCPGSAAATGRYKDMGHRVGCSRCAALGLDYIVALPLRGLSALRAGTGRSRRKESDSRALGWCFPVSRVRVPPV